MTHPRKKCEQCEKMTRKKLRSSTGECPCKVCPACGSANLAVGFCAACKQVFEVEEFTIEEPVV